MSHGTDGYRFYEKPANLHPLWLDFSVVLKRLPRAACQTCGRRRVLFVLAVEPEGPNGFAMCAVCAGVR